ncbi:hypothetical protein DVS77_25010 [Mycolicibacterium moriokaense]|nr:hypothetical protein DVS77_25010 [Mycolicibacterium moriokaense]
MTSEGEAVTRMVSGYEPMIRRFNVLDELFADVDEYVDDPRLRAAGGGLDEDELRARARHAYVRLPVLLLTEELDRLRDALVQCYLRRPSEHLLRPGDVEA